MSGHYGGDGLCFATLLPECCRCHVATERRGATVRVSRLVILVFDGGTGPLGGTGAAHGHSAIPERIRFGGRIPAVSDKIRAMEECPLSNSRRLNAMNLLFANAPHHGFLFFSVIDPSSVFHYQHLILPSKNKVLRRLVEPTGNNSYYRPYTKHTRFRTSPHDKQHI